MPTAAGEVRSPAGVTGAQPDQPVWPGAAGADDIGTPAAGRPEPHRSQGAALPVAEARRLASAGSAGPNADSVLAGQALSARPARSSLQRQGVEPAQGSPALPLAPDSARPGRSHIEEITPPIADDPGPDDDWLADEPGSLPLAAPASRPVEVGRLAKPEVTRGAAEVAQPAPLRAAGRSRCWIAGSACTSRAGAGQQADGAGQARSRAGRDGDSAAPPRPANGQCGQRIRATGSARAGTACRGSAAGAGRRFRVAPGGGPDANCRANRRYGRTPDRWVRGPAFCIGGAGCSLRGRRAIPGHCDRG